MKRVEKRNEKRSEKSFQSPLIFILFLLGAVLLAAFLVLTLENQAGQSWKKKVAVTDQEVLGQEIRIMAHGDLLYHDLIYMSARQEDGSYDFQENFEKVKPWFDKADLLVGDFEGTISPDYPLAGYPLFNAPPQVVTAIKGAGYQVLDLAHNHILDSGLEGLVSTASSFNSVGIDTIGVFAKQDRANSPILIKEIKGIKVAFLAYSYGFNGLEANLTAEEYKDRLADLDEKGIKADLARAEELADFTIVMPQMGVEYNLQPTEEQVSLYHKMVDWGADLVLGGHPHVIEPAEVMEKDGQKKLIIYSMGNFLSNQRLETTEDIWTERGLLMDVRLERTKQGVVIKDATARPSWVRRWEKGTMTEEGYPAYHYQTYLMEDLLENGPYRNDLNSEERERVDQAYGQVVDHTGLSWPQAKFRGLSTDQPVVEVEEGEAD